MNGYPDKAKMCHRTGFEKSCRDLLDARICQDRWVNIIGRNPQTDESINRWGCVDDQAMLIQMSIEHRLVGIQAAVESRGNDTIKMLAEGIMRQERQHNDAMGSAQDRLSNGHDVAPQLLGPQENN